MRNAWFYALMAMAIDDADMAQAVAKLSLMFWRPITAIRTADADGNPDTLADPAWEPLLRTPNQPEYPCGHCYYAATIATVPEAERCPAAADAVFVNEKMPGAGVTVSNWDAYVRAVNESRIQAGAHFRFSIEAGAALGREVARIALAKFAPPIEQVPRRRL